MSGCAACGGILERPFWDTVCLSCQDDERSHGCPECKELCPECEFLLYPVEIDPQCPYEGQVVWGHHDFNGRAWSPKIVLRRFDERVLLHEMLHALIGTDEAGALLPGHEHHEAMVRHVTEGLYNSGWRSPAHNKDMRDALEFAARFIRNAFQGDADAHVSEDWWLDVLAKIESVSL